MIVVSDTSCITTLLKAGEEQLLRALFGAVFVPEAVFRELQAFHSVLPDFVVSTQVSEPMRRLPGTERLGRGEAEAIKLTHEKGADLFLTDDRKAGAAASRLGVEHAGLAALLVRAKQLGLIVSVKEKIELLQTRGGMYLSDTVKTEALRIAGE